MAAPASMVLVPGSSPMRNAGAASADAPSTATKAAAMIASDLRGIGSVPSQRKSIEVSTTPTTPMPSSTASDPAMASSPSPRTITLE